MFNGLDNIEWDKLGASAVPTLLRNMTSDDESIRSYAIDTFNTEILYMDDYNMEGINLQDLLISEIQYLVVPFLIEFLQNDKLPDREWIISSLQFMTGYGEYAYKDSVVETTVKIRQAIWQGFDVYTALLLNQDAKIRRETVRLLSAYPEHAELTVPHLCDLLNTETGDRQLFILSEIDTHFASQNIAVSAKNVLSTTLEKLTVEGETHTLKITAAVTLIDLLGDVAPQPIVDYLTETMITTYNETATVDTLATTTDKQARAIMRLGMLRGIPTAIKIVTETSHWESGFHALLAAIILAFYPDKTAGVQVIRNNPNRWNKSERDFFRVYTDGFIPSTRITLNASQEALLEAIVQTDWVWQIDTDLFEKFGLPKSRYEFRNYL